VKKLLLAVFLAIGALLISSPSYAAQPALSKDPAFKVHNGTNTITAGKMHYTVVVAGGKVVSITPVSSGHMMGSPMSTKSVKFKKVTKNAICYYWWCDVYGRCWYVWEYC